MKLGIVGLPNVGKSTLFNAITNAGAESANYPFCTIDPNVGMVAVPDGRLDWLSDFYHPKKTTPAVVEFVDIAGLVKGASKGEGLGNKFLSNIRATDAIVHVVRCFDDENVIHVEGSTDPRRDIDIIKLNGSIELAPILGLSDVIVDIVETGTTLRENGLRVVTEFMPISARFIANKASYQFKHREMDEMLEKLRAALAAKEEKK